MHLLGLDFETTGIDPKKDQVIEVGAVVWDVVRKIPVKIYSTFVDWEGLQVTDETTRITGITQRDIIEYGELPEHVFAWLSNEITKCEAVVAHNGSVFDRLFYDEWSLKYSHAPNLPSPIWVDTMLDLDYDERITTRHLPYLAAEHGFLNPWAHRAVFDVLTMMRVLSHYDIEQVMYSAKQPVVEVQALVSYDEKELAKEKKFRWDADRKRWTKQMKAHKVEEECSKYPFRTKVLSSGSQIQLIST